jgi:hypothetical protein
VLYDVGDTRVFTYDVHSATDPTGTTAVLTLTKPNATTVTPLVDAGVVTGSGTDWTITFTADPVVFAGADTGQWLGRWASTGVGTAETFQFDVRAQTAYLVGRDDVKTHLNIDPGDTSRDDEVQAVLDAVLAMFDRRGYRATQQYVHDARSRFGTIVLPEEPLVAIVSVTSYDSAGAPTVYTAYDPTAGLGANRYTVRYGVVTLLDCGRRGLVRVVYTAGYSGDAALRWAVMEQVRLWFDEPHGVGSETYAQPTSYAAQISRLAQAGIHPFVEAMLPGRTPLAG